MLNISTLAILSGLTALVIAYFATPFVIKFANKLGAIDDPKKSKHPKVIHTYPVPRVGGLAIFIAVFIASVVFLPLDKHLKGILAGAIILTIMGVLDDKYDLNPYLRLAISFFAAGMPIIAGIGISFISSPFNGIIDLSHP